MLEAQARRGIAIGSLFPQHQDAFGGYQRVGISEHAPTRPSAITSSATGRLGFDAAWELDLWGRFRRGIESSDAELLASVASYDDVLVALVAEVAANYIQLRTLEERLDVAHANVAIQERELRRSPTRSTAPAR